MTNKPNKFGGIMSTDLNVHEVETGVTVEVPEYPVIRGAYESYMLDGDDYSELNFND